MSDPLKTLEQLTDDMNDNPAVFGWKSRCEALTEFAEKLERENAELKSELTACANSCANSCPKQDWCKTCASIRWCKYGQNNAKGEV